MKKSIFLMSRLNQIHAFFNNIEIGLSEIGDRIISNPFFCCLTFEWIEPQMLLTCCLTHISIIMLRLLYYYICNLCLFMSYLRDVFFIFIFIFIMINRIISRIISCSFAYFLDDNLGGECEYFPNTKDSASGCCLTFALLFANFSLALLIKVLLIKKACKPLE